MKKIICILLLFTTFCKADYASNGSGDSRGEAYLEAMSQAPSGNHWILHNIYYTPNGTTCRITWKIKK
jgi:hypothetical protein